ncbi:hypothetical protein PHET_10410 [Paragonimus heterotremus]|uniref:Uncharacterized protein n=1 Tax=Paragonimus heterotremus TaxID=100268 RepID=A0A8J4SUL3_9TREM|nr:hypothetical protein PHET_10410 [Paragonimus heterotremus]
MHEEFGNTRSAVSRGFQMVTEDLLGTTHTQSEAELLGYKRPVVVVGNVLRQIPPTVVAPLVTECELLMERQSVDLFKSNRNSGNLPNCPSVSNQSDTP